MTRKYYRYGVAAEKRLLLDNKDRYHGIVFPAHLVADQGESLPTFVKVVEKQYFVDPMVFPFALKSADFLDDKGEVRRSWNKLWTDHLKAWAPRDLDLAKGAKFSPSDFRAGKTINEAAVEKFARGCLSLQEKLSSVDESVKRYQKIAEKLGKKLPVGAGATPPEFFVSPYFFWNTQDDEWYQITAALARASSALSKNRDTWAVLAVDREADLATIDIGRLIKDFGDARGFVLWIDNFLDLTAQVQALRAVRKFVADLRKAGKPSMMMYGGLFSAALEKDGLVGYSSGLCYGERKPKEAIGGGAIPPRYFVLEAFVKLTRAELEPFLKLMGISCTCETCGEAQKAAGPRGYIGFMEELFADYEVGDSAKLKAHFMQSLHAESKALEKLSSRQVAELIEKRMAALKDKYPAFQPVAHLRRWVEALLI